MDVRLSGRRPTYIQVMRHMGPTYVQVMRLMGPMDVRSWGTVVCGRSGQLFLYHEICFTKKLKFYHTIR